MPSPIIFYFGRYSVAGSGLDCKSSGYASPGSSPGRPTNFIWGRGAIGSAIPLQGKGCEFKSHRFHQSRFRPATQQIQSRQLYLGFYRLAVYRDIAQFGRALVWGTSGCRFKSCYFDHRGLHGKSSVYNSEESL